MAMTGEQMRVLGMQLANISAQATPSPFEAAYALMVAAIMINRARRLPNSATEQMLVNLLEDSSGDPPARLMN